MRNAPDVDIVVLAGETPTGGVALAAAVTPGSPFEAAGLIRDAAKAVGGGGGGKGDVATAGGKDPGGIDEASSWPREAIALTRGEHGGPIDADASPCGSSPSISAASGSASPSATSPARSPRRSPCCGDRRSRRHDHERIAALVRDEEAELVVVGLPISLSGAEGPAARAARTEAEALATLVDVPLETFDERLTTVTAERALAEAGVRGPGPPPGRRQGRRRRHPPVVPRPARPGPNRATAHASPRSSDIDDIDDVDVLETYDWNEDPWDASVGVGEVEQVRTQTRPAKWIGYGCPGARQRRDHRRRPLRLVVHPPGQRPVTSAGPSSSSSPRARTSMLSARLEAEGIVEERRRSSRTTSTTTAVWTSRPATTACPPATRRQRARPAAHAARGDVHRDHLPRGFHPASDRRPAGRELPQSTSTTSSAAANRPVDPAVPRRLGPTRAGGPAVPGHLPVSNADSERQVITRMAEQMERVGGQEDIDAGPVGVAPVRRTRS